MPRNCSIEDPPENIELVDIDELVSTVDRTRDLSRINEAWNIIEEELEKIILEYQSRQYTDRVVQLRADMSNYVNSNIPSFVGEEDMKEFTQFVNTMIHISQEHLEEILKHQTNPEEIIEELRGGKS